MVTGPSPARTVIQTFCSSHYTGILPLAHADCGLPLACHAVPVSSSIPAAGMLST